MDLFIYTELMFDLPDQERWLEVTSYTDIFMLTLLWNVAIYGVGVFLLFIIMLILKLYHLHQQKQQRMVRQSLLTYQSGSRDSQVSMRTSKNENPSLDPKPEQEEPAEIQEQPLPNRKTTKITGFDVISFLTSLTFYLTLIFIALVYLIFFMFGFMGRSTGHDILAVMVMLVIVALPTMIWKYNTRVKHFKLIKKEVIVTGVLLALWLGLSIFAVIALKGVCICVFNDNYGIKIHKDFMFSTEWTRFTEIKETKICPDGKICHIYATLAENGAKQVFINLHTGTDLTNISVTLASKEHNYTKYLDSPYSLTNIDSKGHRNIFHAYFNELTAETNYTVTITNEENGKVLNVTKYNTLPDENGEEIRMAVGGDVGLDEMAKKLTSNVVSFDPHVVVLGGDIAYDDGMRTCFYSWDNFYEIFEGLNDQLGRLVPLVMTVGNHDVGFNALASVLLDLDDVESMPYFFLFNPQHLTTDGRIPSPSQRKTYHYHIMGPTVHVHLDSGYIQKYGNQKYFIELIAKNFSSHIKFANYHNPLYPSCTDSTKGSNDVNVIKEGFKEWVPLFDHSGFAVAFEHHTHHRKMTEKIWNNTVIKDKSKGTRYIGDGSWGVPEGICSKERFTKHPEFFIDYEKNNETNPNHVWKVRVLKTTDTTHTIEYVAVNDENKTVFTYHDDL